MQKKNNLKATEETMVIGKEKINWKLTWETSLVLHYNSTWQEPNHLEHTLTLDMEILWILQVAIVFCREKQKNRTQVTRFRIVQEMQFRATIHVWKIKPSQIFILNELRNMERTKLYPVNCLKKYFNMVKCIGNNTQNSLLTVKSSVDDPLT